MNEAHIFTVIEMTLDFISTTFWKLTGKYINVFTFMISIKTKPLSTTHQTSKNRNKSSNHAPKPNRGKD